VLRVDTDINVRFAVQPKSSIEDMQEVKAFVTTNHPKSKLLCMRFNMSAFDLHLSQ
jgi:hypothetical protein